MAQSEIDAFYDKIVRGMPDDQLEYFANRKPANEPQVQPTTVITPNIINPVPGLNYPIAENYRQNVDESLKSREGLSRDLRSDIPNLANASQQSMAQARKSSRNLSAPSAEYVPNAQIESQIAEAQKQASAPVNTERDLLTEAILSFGPALGGMVLGENAQIDNTGIQSRARQIYESQRSEKIKYLQDAKENASKRVEYLQKLKQSDREAFDKRQEREFNKLKALAESDMKFAEMDTKQMNEAIKQFTDAEQKFADAYEKGSGKYAELAQTPEDLKAREKRAGIIASGQNLKEASALRKEFTSLPQVKNFGEIEASYNKIQSAFSKPSAAGDLSGIFAYMKMLDPGSTVREGEFANAQNSAGIPDQIRNLYNQLRTGERLNPNQRKDFLNQAAGLYNAQQSIVSKLETDYQGLAGTYGAKGETVIPRTSKAIQIKPDYKDGDKKTINGMVYTRKNGKWVK